MRIRFQPRSFYPPEKAGQSPRTPGKREPQPGEPDPGPGQPQDPGNSLKAENPWLVRTVDTFHVGLHFAEHAGLGETASRAGNGALAVGATVWGANKLFGGQTILDRVEGVASLALAGHAGMEAGAVHHPVAGTALSLIHSGGELIIGTSDLLRGRNEHDGRRATAGLFQTIVGAAGITGQLCPPAGGIASAVALAAGIGRQLAIG